MSTWHLMLSHHCITIVYTLESSNLLYSCRLWMPGHASASGVHYGCCRLLHESITLRVLPSASGVHYIASVAVCIRSPLHYECCRLLWESITLRVLPSAMGVYYITSVAVCYGSSLHYKCRRLLWEPINCECCRLLWESSIAIVAIRKLHFSSKILQYHYISNHGII